MCFYPMISPPFATPKDYMAKRLGEEQPLVFTVRLYGLDWLDHRLCSVFSSIPPLRHILIEDSPSHIFWMILDDFEYIT